MILYWIGFGLVGVGSLFLLYGAIWWRDPPVISDFGPIIAYAKRQARRCRLRSIICGLIGVGFLCCSIGLSGSLAPSIYGFGAGVNLFMVYAWQLRRREWFRLAANIENLAVSMLRNVINELQL